MAEKRAGQQADEGVFGNLPSSRPGVRSPRRASGAAEQAPEPQAEARSQERPEAEARTASAPEPPPPPPPPPPAGLPPAGGERIRGVEDLAWAGVAVAAQAATAGVRAASRVLEAVRKPRDSG